ncbi:MAG: orotate phosphoribosyltransferase [Termitinemataceae bacterium]|nr:MAG: orotate phosphoribosyltransferase [Termitinemataceae bacterium]
MANVTSILSESKALLGGHFLLSSGRHSNKYFQCARLLQHPDKAEAVLSLAASVIKADIKAGRLKVDAICGPAMGGIIVAYELGRLLCLPAFFTERGESGDFELRRGFEVKSGENILIAEDVVTTGKSSMETRKVLEAMGAKTTAIACIVDRREDGVSLDLPLYSCVKEVVESWDPSSCPFCKNGVPFVKPGSRNKF